MTPLRKPNLVSGLRTPDFKRRFGPKVEAVEAAGGPDLKPPPLHEQGRAGVAVAFPARSTAARVDAFTRPRERVEAEAPGTALAPLRGRAIAIPTRVMGLVRDTAAGVLLCQLIYWTRRGVDVLERDGWVYKTAGEWQQETGMSWKVQRRARTLLQSLDLVEERKQEMPARLEFRLKLSTLAPLLAERAELAELQPGQLDLARFRDGENPIADDLIGRAFLFHGVLAKVFPLHSAMLCSRLLAPARIATLDAQSMVQAAGRGSGSYTRLVTLQREEWHAETGLSRDQWQTARRNLREAGVLIERKHNFPRRVDLAVNLRALSEVLRQSASRAAEAGQEHDPDHEQGHDQPNSPYRQDRAKQAGGIGHRPFPPRQSPDPADKDRPILPIEIAQSRLYPFGLQSSLHPQPQGAGPGADGRSPNHPSAALLWGGGGFYEVIKTEYRPSEGSFTAAGAAQPGLSWPSCFSEADRAMALAHLAGLDRAIQQQLLDEIDWQSTAGNPVRSPVALTRSLARKALAGEFVPDGAHRIAEARERAQREEAQRRQTAERRAVEGAPGPVALTEKSRAERERLKAATEQLRRRQA